AAEVVKAGARQKEGSRTDAELALSRLDKFRNARGSTRTSELRDQMQRTMQNHCAVFRDAGSLKEGCDQMKKVCDGRRDLNVSDRSLIWNSDLVETIELDNLIYQAMATVAGALNRTESRGAHAREDFPKRDDDKWMNHTLAWVEKDSGVVRLGARPVHMF